MMKLFTKKIILAIALLSSIGANAQFILSVNSPSGFQVQTVVVRGAIGVQDDLVTTGDLVVGDDMSTAGTAGTIYDGCQAITNNVSGKIAIVDRGGCNFFIKGQNAAAAGAIALLVCNNATTPAFAMGLGPNGEGTDISIPCYMATKSFCDSLKVVLSATTVNATIQKFQKTCPVTYPESVFWGDMPGEGDFNDGLNGWTTVNLLPEGREDVVWEFANDDLPVFPQFFGSGELFTSPSGCSGHAEFSFVKFAIGDNPSPAQPYVQYSSELISPIINCTGEEKVVLEYWQAYNRLNSFSRFAWSTDGGQTWSPEVNVEYLGTVNGAVDMRKVTQIMPQFDNQPACRIKFIANGDFYYWGIDDVVLRSGDINEIRANTNWYSGAPNYIAPENQPDQIPFVLDIQNLGNTTLTNVKVVAEVSKDGSVVHRDSVSYGSIGVDSTAENNVFPNTFTPAKGVGNYTIKYTVKTDSLEDDFDNNVVETDFVLGGNVMSKLPVGFGIGNWGSPEVNSRSYGNWYRFSDATTKNIRIDSIITGFTQTETEEIIGFLNVEIYTWVDLNGDRAVSPDERTLVGGVRTDVAEDGLFSLPIYGDIELSEGELVLDGLQDGEGILVMTHVESLNNPRRWNMPAVQANQEIYNLQATAFAYNQLGISNYGSFDADGGVPVEERTFVESEQLTYYSPITVSFVSNSVDLDSSIKIATFPNPTSEVLNVDVNLENTQDYILVQVVDMTGRAVKGIKYNNLQSKKISLNLSDVPAGLYNVKVSTPTGFNTTNITVQK